MTIIRIFINSSVLHSCFSQNARSTPMSAEVAASDCAHICPHVLIIPFGRNFLNLCIQSYPNLRVKKKSIDFNHSSLCHFQNILFSQGSVPYIVLVMRLCTS